MTATFLPFKASIFALAALLGVSACSTSAPTNPRTKMTPHEPIAVSLPLDKAGHEVDTTFWVLPGKPDGKTGHFVGLRIPLSAGDPDQRLQRMEAHTVKVRATLHRMEGGQESKVPVRHLVNKTRDTNQPKNNVVELLPDDEATAKLNETVFAPTVGGGTKGSGNATYSFGAMGDLNPGQYRLRVRTLSELPALRDVPAELVVERGNLPK